MRCFFFLESLNRFKFVLEVFLDFMMSVFRFLNPTTLSVKICCETGDSVFGLSVLVRFNQLGTGFESKIFKGFFQRFRVLIPLV